MTLEPFKVALRVLRAIFVRSRNPQWLPTGMRVEGDLVYLSGFQQFLEQNAVTLSPAEIRLICDEVGELSGTGEFIDIRSIASLVADLVNSYPK